MADNRNILTLRICRAMTVQKMAIRHLTVRLTPTSKTPISKALQLTNSEQPMCNTCLIARVRRHPRWWPFGFTCFHTQYHLGRLSACRVFLMEWMPAIISTIQSTTLSDGTDSVHSARSSNDMSQRRTFLIIVFRNCEHPKHAFEHPLKVSRQTLSPLSALSTRLNL